MINALQFRVDFPEFADQTLYPDSAVNFWLSMAKQMINVCRWGGSALDVWPNPLPVDPAPPVPDRTLYDLGCELFVAFNLAIERNMQNQATAGGVPGQVTGPVSAKSVDKVSVSYDVAAGLNPEDGMWNMNAYGVRFVYLLKLMGMGTLQLGIGAAPPYSGFGYYGPYPWQ